MLMTITSFALPSSDNRALNFIVFWTNEFMFCFLIFSSFYRQEFVLQFWTDHDHMRCQARWEADSSNSHDFKRFAVLSSCADLLGIQCVMSRPHAERANLWFRTSERRCASENAETFPTAACGVNSNSATINFLCMDIKKHELQLALPGLRLWFI